MLEVPLQFEEVLFVQVPAAQGEQHGQAKSRKARQQGSEQLARHEAVEEALPVERTFPTKYDRIEHVEPVRVLAEPAQRRGAKDLRQGRALLRKQRRGQERRKEEGDRGVAQRLQHGPAMQQLW